MRQVGRSVQCRQNRRGRTAATWPYSVRIKGSRNFPTSGLRCGGRDGGARENSGLARTAPHERTLSVDSPAALAEAGRGPRCHCGGGLRLLFCGDLRSQLSNPSGDRDPPGKQPIRRVVLPGHPLLCDNRRELSCGPPGWMVAGTWSLGAHNLGACAAQSPGGPVDGNFSWVMSYGSLNSGSYLLGVTCGSQPSVTITITATVQLVYT